MRHLHVVSPNQQNSNDPGIPSFMAIAGKPDRDDEFLIRRMIHPFPPMIDVHLSEHEMRDLVAYIRALQK